MRLHIQLLGRFRVTVDDNAIPADAFRRERGAALVKLLALAPDHRLHREQVMETFFPDLDPDAAGANLRKAVHFARRALGEHRLLELDGEVLALAPSAELRIDAVEFEAAAKTALRSQDSAVCEQAADLYGGELLPDDRYVEWLEEPRTQLKERYARVLKAGKLWERLVELDPTDEQAQCALMQAALDAGNRGEVIRLFQRLRERLRVDLGVGPKAATVELYERALATTDAAPTSVLERVRASLAWGLVHMQSGDFAKAERIARETREIALAADLSREVGECTALLGQVAHMQGRFPELVRAEFQQWVRIASGHAPNILDSHVCLTQFCLCGAGGHQQIGMAASELLKVADAAGSDAGRAFAMLCLGEVELFSGNLKDAEPLLTASAKLHAETAGIAGQVMALQRLGELNLSAGDKKRACELVERARVVAESSWLSPHLLIRLMALMVETAPSIDDALDEIALGDRAIEDGGICQPCSMGFRIAAAMKLAEAGELDRVAIRLDEAERICGMWGGGPWVAALWEARGVQRRAQGSLERAVAAFSEAAGRFGDLGRRLDEDRCRARMRGQSEAARPV